MIIDKYLATCNGKALFAARKEVHYWSGIPQKQYNLSLVATCQNNNALLRLYGGLSNKQLLKARFKHICTCYNTSLR